MREIKDRQEVFVCQCQMLEHQFAITLFDDEDPRLVDISMEPMFNTYLPWYKKVLVCIKYIFGYHSKYGLFDNMLLKPEDIGRLESILNEYKEKRCLKG